MTQFSRVFCFALALIFALNAGPSLAHKRLALVIGNAGYTNVPALDNPINDAHLMRDTLKDAGFEVTMITDADRAEIMQAVESFGKEVRAAKSETFVFFFYAGHGVRSNDFNYLIPVGVNIQAEEDIAREAVSAEWVLDRIHAPRSTSVMILDACRDNPFQTDQPGVIADLGDGLARMTARRNNLIAYATGPGDVALDGSSNNSPYTEALVRAMQTPRLPVEDIFERARLDVVEKTQGLQVPWATSSVDITIGIKNHAVVR